MAFFEELGKRISDAGQGVAQQTKNFTEITRLNGAISDKEKKIAQVFAAIGQAYYQAHKDDQDAEQRPYLEQVNALYEEIAQCQEEVKKIRGVETCPSCGAELPAQSAFCTSCGAKIERKIPEPAPAPEGEKICPSCQAPVPAGSLFCVHCGARMEDGT